MSRKVVLPPYIYCVRCASKVEMIEENPELVKEQGYTAIARGICECGVVYVLCYQPLPASPTFSLFFDVYPSEIAKKILLTKKKT